MKNTSSTKSPAHQSIAAQAIADRFGRAAISPRAVVAFSALETLRGALSLLSRLRRALQSRRDKSLDGRFATQGRIGATRE
jgi:hypothetical protein